ncbi:MAG TPA: D-alanine--D-alanine ligase family protein [Gaiellaceae bacterium]|jgi:D-alanine-D-alanine ligase|nr:D-alanine--D-alanine ligase family protein [Gaiellaceae bacterium]
MSSRVRVAVIAGGRSSEHEISVASARSVIDALDPDRYEVQTIEIGRDGRWELNSGSSRALDRPVAETLPVPTGSPPETLGEVDVVLPILHGPFGEDGTVQGLLELAGVPYVGAGVTASALCMDKDLFKSVCRDKGIRVTQSVTLRNGDQPSNPFGYPVFVKPSRLGSSVGITKVQSEAGLDEAVELARRHDEKVLVEEFVDGVEVECGVLGNREPIASLPGEIVAHGFGGVDWYDYSAKYDEGGMELIIPPRVSEEAAERVQQVSVDAFIASDCEGMARVDCFVTNEGEVLVNELNTIPGFTATSVYAKLFEASGLPYHQLLDRLIEFALERHERRGKLEY